MMITHAGSLDRAPGVAPLVALLTGALLAAAIVAVTIVNPTAIPTWCLAHGGCPPVGAAHERAHAPETTRTAGEATKHSESARTERKPGFVPCP